MKKGVAILLILIFSVSLVSAGWFGDLSDKKITGKAIYDNELDISNINYSGYIIEFEKTPLSKTKNELEVSAEKNSKSLLNKIPLIKQIYDYFVVLPDEVLREISDYSNETIIEHEQIKKEILSKIFKGNETLVGNYLSLFNGIALNISDSEAEQIKNIEGVKRVWPNVQVKASLYESVLLIQGGINSGQLDEDGNDCIISGKTCLTGEGVKIAILDTGVDYLHEDLGCVDTRWCGLFIYNQLIPNLWEDKIVWIDDRNKLGDIYMCDITLNGQEGGCLFNDDKTQITSDSYHQESALIYRDKIIWHDDRNGNSDIFMYDLSTNEERQITDDSYFQVSFSIYEDKIVGINSRNRNLDIFMYDLSTNEERQITDDSSTQFDPVIYGDKIVWHDDRNGNWDLYMYDLSTDEEIQITNDPSNQFFSSIYESKIVWIDDRNPGGDIYMCDITFNGQDGGCLANDKKTPITKDSFGQGQPQIHEDKIVWHDDRNRNFDIYMYDLIAKTEIQITTDFSAQVQPKIHEDKIVWHDNRNGNVDIYMYDLSLGQEIQITSEDISRLFPNSKVIGGYDFVNNDPYPLDNNGHGTHVATIAAGNGILKGVAPNADILAYKVLDYSGFSHISTIISGIERAVADGADVISLSLGGPGNPDDPMSQAVDNAVDEGVIVVVAAGNCGPDGNPEQCPKIGEETIESPGTARKAITVGASNKSDYLAGFSSRGPVIWQDEQGNTQSIIKPDIVAPGVDICSAQWQDSFSVFGAPQCIDNDHVSISGTSMATPHIAGIVALLKQKNPSYSPEDIKDILMNNAIDLGILETEQGSGRVDLLSALGNIIPTFEICNDSLDNDMDDLIDCNDLDCEFDSYCEDLPQFLTEKVTCIFLNSNQTLNIKNTCSAEGENILFQCSGMNFCFVDVSGEKDTKLSWSSSCGGTEETIIDGIDESVKFECLRKTQKICIKCPDLNGDGIVNNEDGVLFYSCSSEGSCPDSYDLNDDGIISILSDVNCLSDNLDKSVEDIDLCKPDRNERNNTESNETFFEGNQSFSDENSNITIIDSNLTS